MPICHFDTYSRDIVSEYPHITFVFGDNLKRRGNAGQAVIRGLSNAYGIPTKHKPSNSVESFFDDDDLVCWEAVCAAFTEIETLLAFGKIIAFPTAGIGTGLARLPEKAPLLASFIDAKIHYLCIKYGKI